MKDSTVNAFMHRTLPESLTGTQLRNPTDKSVLEKLEKCIEWTIPVSFLEQEYDFLSLIDGEAFCYFLPRVIHSSFELNRPDLLVVDVLVSDLDRSPRKDYWDNFFMDRWPRLTKPELLVVSEWITWLSNTDDWSNNNSALVRSMDTLDLLLDIKRHL